MDLPELELESFLFLGATSSLGLYYPVLMPCFTTLFTIVHGAPVLFWNGECCRGIDKPSHTFGFPVVYSPRHKPWVRLGDRPTSLRVA